MRRTLHHQSSPALSLKAFHVRLALPEDSLRLTGYPHGAVTPFALQQKLPVFLSHKIAALQPPIMYLGGGSVTVKLALGVDDFIEALRPCIADITSAEA